MGVHKANDQIYLAEWGNGGWVKYEDYKPAIPAGDLWFDPPTTTQVVQLSTHCMSYNFVGQNGRENIGGWIELAAALAVVEERAMAIPSSR
jgi:hypothetical protein